MNEYYQDTDHTTIHLQPTKHLENRMQKKMTRLPAIDEHRLNTPEWQTVESALKRFGFQQDALIEVLHIAQQAFGYLPEQILIHIARQLRLPLSWVFGVASFYHFFSFKKAPQHTCIICTGTACYVEGATSIIKTLENELNIKLGETTPDGRVNLIDFRCPGSCGLAPIIVLDGEMLGRETPASILKKIKKLKGADHQEGLQL